MSAHGVDRDTRGAIDRVAVDARADRRERDRTKAVGGRERERLLVATAQERGLTARAAAPDGPDGVDHVAREQAEPGRDARVARRAASDLSAGLEQLAAGRAVDRAVHAAA